MSFISIVKGLYIDQIFVFHFPTKVVPQCLLKLTPLSSDNNLVRQSVSLLRLPTYKAR